MPEVISSDIAAWINQAKTSLAHRDFAAAEGFCKHIINADNKNAEAHFLLASIAFETKQYKPTVNLLQRAIALDDKYARYFALLGRTYSLMHEKGLALESADHAASLASVDAVTLDTIGCIYSYGGAHEQAAKQFGRAVELRPTEPQFQYNHAVALRFMGDLAGAEQAYKKALEADPHFYKAHWSLSHLRRQTDQDNHIEQLESLLKQLSDNEDAKIFLHNGLAKEYEDIGKYDHAFQHLSAGNVLVRQGADYSSSDDIEIFEAVENNFSQSLMGDSAGGYETDEPVFLVGMPRTGTTLVERILTSHSAVYSAGELSNFGQQLKSLSGVVSAKVLDAATLAGTSHIDPAVLGKAYLDSTRPETGKTARFVDKLPLNFLNIGFIHRALPNARIVCIRRNPMDTCLSNYRQLFPPEKAIYYRYSFDLLETGRYYLLFDQLMRYWDEVLPGKVLRVDYEQVVANQESESRRLIEFCGLDWEDDCLNFEKNTAPVATASSAQVRQPIYTNAVERWKRYEQDLQPLKEFFDEHGVTI